MQATSKLITQWEQAKELNSKIKELSKQLDMIKKSVKSEMGNSKDVFDFEREITLFEISTSIQTDNKAFKAVVSDKLGPDVVQAIEADCKKAVNRFLIK